MEDVLYSKVYNYGLKFDSKIKANVDDSLVKLYLLANTNLNYPKLTFLLKKVPRKLHKSLFVLIFHIRNPRGGLGQRMLGRYAYQWLLINFPGFFREIYKLIPTKGRWDDIYWLFPKALKLSNIQFVRKNYNSKITEETREMAMKVQNEIVRYVSSVFLENFSNYMQGLPYDRFFIKWLPSEHSSLNRSFHIVAELCHQLNISLVDYRVIYVSPMRKKLNLPESLACAKDWDCINFKNSGKKCLKIMHRTYSNKSSTYKTWRKTNTEGYFIQPALMIDLYLKECLTNKTFLVPDREIEWNKTIKLARQFFNGDSICIVDTRGGMYIKSKNFTGLGNLKYISIALGLAANCSHGKQNFSYTFRNLQGFTRHDFSHHLLDVVNSFRSQFCDYPKIKDIFSFINITFKENIPETVIFVGAEKPVLPKEKIEGNFTLIWWYITSKTVSFEKQDNVILISGCTRDIYNYLMYYGNYNLHTSVSMIIN